MQKLDNNNIRLSVRNLVEFVLRSGDLDNRRSASADRDAMAAGSRIHRKIQKGMGAGYQSEVTLRHVVELDGCQITVEGRADGVLTRPDGSVVIDEIKGIYQNLGHLEEPILVHKAQAMCYGYFYCCDKKLPFIGIQMTYCNIETEEIRRFQEELSFEELEDWFGQVIREYGKWAEYLLENRQRRKAGIDRMEFPFPYREGQRDLAVGVYRTISRKKTLFIQAPTGIGKTLSTVFPSLKAIGEGYGDKLFYLTAKTVTRTVAEECFAILREQGLYFSTVTITAKEKLCFTGEKECNPDACPYAKGHYDRVNEAVFDIIHEVSAITREKILEYAKRYQVCPFEYCLDISNWVDGIICDYNYVFDPDVSLKRYFADGIDGDYIFLVDEAHNLVGRAREMYSAALVKEDVLEAKRILKGKSSRLVSALEKCNKLMLEMKRECDSYEVLTSVSPLAAAAMSAMGELEEFMDDHPEFEGRDRVLEFYFTLRSFLSVCELLDEKYRIYSEHLEDGRFMVRLFCVNPATNLRRCLDKGNSTIFFSATMLPIQYYKELLSGNPEDYAIYAKSPFDPSNRLLAVSRDVSSRYTRRTETEFRKIGEYILQVGKARKGNYMVFFPSYYYMTRVWEMLEEMKGSPDRDQITIVMQQSNMREEDREEFLQLFEEARDESLMAFCVMGGVFSEGIDLKEERLIGAVIIGTGLPQINTEGEILRQYFEDNGKKGFDFAYQYPGMNKVLQAAGRVIRTSRDRGVVVLLDDRFLKPDYQELFPMEWDSYYVVDKRNVAQVLCQFWDDFTKCP